MHKLAALLLAFSARHCRALDHWPIPATQNANHIFNAIHNSMRQWGSSLHHNGMSVFIATVPEGTQLYHGTSEPDPVTGREWLAFEPEHAMVFAGPREGPPSGAYQPFHGDQPPHYGPEESDWQPPQSLESYPSEGPHHDLRRRALPAEQEQPLSHTMAQRERARVHYDEASIPEPTQAPYGYLHTYRAKHNLRSLYIDGQSAAKSSKGTLDLQDMVLLHHRPPPNREPRHPPPSHDRDQRRRDAGRQRPEDRHPGNGPMNEGCRAERLCDLANNSWGGRIHGFLRMELGFEIILCSFEADLSIEHISQVREPNENNRRYGLGDGSLNYLQAVAARYDGVGGDRARIDNNNFTTLYSFEDVVYFDKEGLPRVNNVTKVLQPVLEAIDAMVASEPSTPLTNRQAITDMVIARYSDRIQRLAADDYNSADDECFARDLHNAVRPFIDHAARDRAAEIWRCTAQFFPDVPRPKGNIAEAAIYQVTTRICTSLFEATDKSHSDAVKGIRSLKTWLNWASFKRCRGCASDEVCFIPIWPLGGKGDYDDPHCISSVKEVGSGYWGRRGGPPPPSK